MSATIIFLRWQTDDSNESGKAGGAGVLVSISVFCQDFAAFWSRVLKLTLVFPLSKKPTLALDPEEWFLFFLSH